MGNEQATSTDSKEIARQKSRTIDRTIRRIKREIDKLEKAENKKLQEIKKLANKSLHEKGKSLAEEVIVNRQAVKYFQTMVSYFTAISFHIRSVQIDPKLIKKLEPLIEVNSSALDAALMESVIREILNELKLAGVDNEIITSEFPDRAFYSGEVGTADELYDQILGEMTDSECKCCKEW